MTAEALDAIEINRYQNTSYRQTPKAKGRFFFFSLSNCHHLISGVSRTTSTDFISTSNQRRSLSLIV